MAVITGTQGNDVLIGTPGDDTIDGLGGADSLSGGDGNDILIGGPGETNELVGGKGNDTYVVSVLGDTVYELAGEGTDTVQTALAYYSLRDNVENLIFSGSGDFTGVGNDAANLIIGGAGNDVLDGGLGADSLVGGDGNDLLFGGAGAANEMIGGKGNDSYVVSVLGDTVYEVAGEGTDTVRTALAGYTIGANIENLIYVGTGDFVGTGNDAANAIIGGAGNDILDGGLGADSLTGGGGNDILIGGAGATNELVGGTGNDTYIVSVAGDTVFEVAGEGTDSVQTALASYTLGANVENLVYTGGGDFIGTGNDLANLLVGGGGNDILDGGLGADSLSGGAGDDLLIGGSGAANELIGGLGNDTYVVSAGDSVVEAAGEGTDTVRTALSSYTLSANVEILTYTGAGSFSGTGNGLANILTGGAASDILTGLGGADTFVFASPLGAGNIDTITDFTTGIDRIQLSGNAGEPFVALAAGALATGSFATGSAAADANDYIVYNSATGALLYDADGNGAGAAVQFATLATGLNLTAGDFIVSGPANHLPTVTSGASASVAENSPAATVVYQASGTDADGDRITWALGGADAGALSIDPVTGEVRLLAPADFETKSSYSFTVSASDSAGPSAAKAVTLSITDVADTATTPIINETAAANNSSGSAQAIDRNILVVATNGDLPDQSLPSATIKGSVSSNNDVDFYSITLQAGEKIVLDIDHTTNSLDSFVRFYGPNGVEIVNNDDKISADPGSSTPWTDHNTDSYLTYRVVTSGTYYFSVESFGDLNNDGDDDGPTVGESNGAYSLNVSIGPPATPAQIFDEDIDALISGAQWNHNALTFGFPTDVSQYPSGIKETTPATDFTPFSAAQQAAAASLVQQIASVSALTFQQLSANPGSADIRYAMSSEADVAYAYYPTNGGPNSIGGTAWFNKSDFNNPVKGNYAWMGILHETGHTLGLKHGHEAPAVSADHDSVEYTVMTYRSFPGDDINGYTNEQWGYPQTLMMLDIAALQRVYGANFNTNSGSSVYSWSASTGEMSINGIGQGAPGNGIGGSANRVFETIWDGGGNDTYDLSNYSTNVTVDLRPGEWSSFGMQIAFLGLKDGINHYARGNVANALLYQGNTASLIENAVGGSGFDTLIANQAANHLTGNAGSDTFKWMAATDGGTGALADTIMDFTRGADKIDFDGITHNTGIPMEFIGTAAFDHTRPELRYDVTGGSAHLFADLDGNGTADIEIILNNVTVVAGSDFSGGVHSSSDAEVPSALAAAAPAPAGAPADAFVAASAPDSEVTGRAFNDFGGPAHADLAAMHNLAVLSGPDFYY
jgi:Ca2+-binding RTX toxin-like protein